MKGSESLAVYGREEFRDSATWDGFVDRHAAGYWWHRQAWLDYSLAYDSKAVDRSFAIVSQAGGYPRVMGVCPAIEREGLVCMGAGDVACAGPLSVQHDNAEYAAWCLDAMVRAMQSRLGGVECWWSWNREPCDCRDMGAVLASRLGLERSVVRTSLVPVHGERVWSDVRKSYRALVLSAAREYDIGYGFESLWPHYEMCHRQCATRPRDGDTYLHQLRWLRQGSAFVVVALPRRGGVAGAMDQGGWVASPLSWASSGSGPDPSATLAAAFVLLYKGRAYYASGPSLQPNLQHALQWAAIQAIEHLGGHTYELGHDTDDGIGFFKRGFGKTLGSVDVVRGVA
jgi:hypothetical protein